MNILVQGGRVVDPASGRDELADIAIASGRIVTMGAVSAEFAVDRCIDAVVRVNRSGAKPGSWVCHALSLSVSRLAYSMNVPGRFRPPS